jgi:hypothetical protein
VAGVLFLERPANSHFWHSLVVTNGLNFASAMPWRLV